MVTILAFFAAALALGTLVEYLLHRFFLHSRLRHRVIRRHKLHHDPWSDLRLLLEEELSHLPDNYRAVLVLCDLEGGKRASKDWPLVVGTGKVGLRHERVFGHSSSGQLKIDLARSKLATGTLEREITPAPPAAAEKK